MAAKSQKKKTEPYVRKFGGEMAFEGFERQLFSWLRQQRQIIAMHKALYYEFDEPVLEDKQYDYIEYRLVAVESRHPDLSAAVTAEGYLSPNDYVDSLKNLTVSLRARAYLDTWNINDRPYMPLPMVTAEHTDDKLYDEALAAIKSYPI